MIEFEVILTDVFLHCSLFSSFAALRLIAEPIYGCTVDEANIDFGLNLKIGNKNATKKKQKNYLPIYSMLASGIAFDSGMVAL